MNNIELPMNLQPWIRSNVSRASLFSVLTSEQYAGKLNAVIDRIVINEEGREQIYGYDNSFSEENKNIEVVMDEGVLKIFSHPYQEKKYIYIYKKITLTKGFLFEVKINYIQDSNALTSIKLLLSDGNQNDMQNSEKNGMNNELFICLNPKGKVEVHSGSLEKNIIKKNVNIKAGVILRIELNEQLEIKYSTDNITWIEMAKIECDLVGKMTEAGVLFEPHINPFFYDFFASHLQLCCTSDTMIIAPHFESYERFFSSALQCMQIPMDMINIKEKEVVHYFVELIEKGYYINLGLNEYFIPNRSFYHAGNFVHVNFIYGVDKEKRVFKLMGFDTFLKFDEIGFDDFFLAIQREYGPMSKINVYKYDSKSYPIQMNLKLIIQMLEAYLNSERIVAVSSSKTIVIDEKEPIIFGTGIIDNILKNKTAMNAFIYDERIAFQIQEHIKIVMEMVNFLNFSDILKDVVSEQLLKELKGVSNIASIMLNLIIKNSFSEITDIRNRLKRLLTKLKESEEIVISELLLELKKIG